MWYTPRMAWHDPKYVAAVRFLINVMFGIFNRSCVKITHESASEFTAPPPFSPHPTPHPSPKRWCVRRHFSITVEDAEANRSAVRRGFCNNVSAQWQQHQQQTKEDERWICGKNGLWPGHWQRPAAIRVLHQTASRASEVIFNLYWGFKYREPR